MKITQETTISELQEYVRRMCQERGFDGESVSEKLGLFVEEVGELARGIRKYTNVAFADDTRKTDIAHELADLQFVLLNLANKLGVDIAQAFEAKEKKNRQRNWK